jgi:putative MATE family efflux protein
MAARLTQRNVDLLTAPIDSSLRRFALPLGFSFLAQMFYSLIDRFYVSRLGDAAIAAIGASDQLVFLSFTLGSGFAVGTGIIVARRTGEGNRTEANRTATQAIVGMVMLAGLITGILYGLIPLLPTFFSFEPRVIGLSQQYLSMLFIGFIANLVNFQISAMVRSTGNAVYPMMILLLTTVINAVIAPFLIFGIGPFPRMEMSGAGLATALAQISGCIISAWALTNGKATIHFDFSRFKLDLGLLARIAKLGLPASLQMMSVSINRLIIFSIVAAFGTNVVAAYTLGLTLDMVTYMIVFAMGLAVEIATGQNLGAGNVNRVVAYHRSAMRQLGILMTGLAVGVYFFGTYFASVYTSDPQTLHEATDYMHVTVLGYIPFAIGLVSVRVISGAGAAFKSLAITAGSLLGLQLLTSWALSRTPLAQHGVWWGITAGYLFFAVISYLAVRSRSWVHVRV